MSLLPNPSLIAIILTISTHNGPQLVFSYPPAGASQQVAAPQDLNSDEMTDSESEADASSEDEDDGEFGKTTVLDILDKRDHLLLQNRRAKTVSEHSVSSFNSNDHSASSPHKILGFTSEFLSEVLNPPKQLCNSRFELSIDNMAFVSLPIHTNEHGLWRNKKKKKSRHSNTVTTRTDESESDNNSDNSDDEHGVRANMNMFNLVFVLSPPVAEYNSRVDEMFHYVVSRLSLVLRYEQAKSNYVWNESLKILKIKEDNEHLSAFELYRQINAESSLAVAISSCFNAISTSNIANLQINDKLISLQIPLKNQFSSLPSRTTSTLPGSFLSSTVDSDYDMSYMALLLLDSPDSIITDLNTEINSSLAKFIHSINPCFSIYKLSILNKIDINQLKSFANHLIYWRRARCIIPLQTKSVFIVSPMAPIKSIHADITTFKKEFPSLPSLSSFLSLLSSSKPRPYSTIIPSKDHRDIYIDALAWLIRSGYVTQLLTFVWIKISNRIKIAVDEDLENEGITKRSMVKKTDLSIDNTSKSNTQSEAVESVLLEEEDEQDTILLDPESATAVERRWINKIIKNQSPEVGSTFKKLVKYFNGKTPLEVIIVKENVSRHELRRMLHAVSEHVISVKHW